MSVTMDDSIKRWTVKRKTALVVEINSISSFCGRAREDSGGYPPWSTYGNCRVA